MAMNPVVVSHEEKRIHEFYQIVYLLQSLGVRRGDRIRGGPSEKQEPCTVAKHRRNVADALAYMAAYDKKPDRVTAVALGKEEGRLVVWIAANKRVRDKVKDFLATVLNWLDKIACGTESEKGDFLNFVLWFNREGVNKYYENFLYFWGLYYKPHKSTSLQILGPRVQETHMADESRIGHDVLQELDIWIRRTFYRGDKGLQLEDMANLAKECHQARKRGRDVFDMLREASGQGIMSPHEYEQLHSLLYKIGKNVTLCRKLIDARMSLPEDFKQGTVVKSVYVPPRRLNGIKRNYSFDSISTHIFQSESEKQAFYDHVNRFYDPDVVSEQLQNCAKYQPPVHAEIQLISHFDTHNSRLLDERNPYIGCSKPACYLCYKYITDHPRQWFRPPSHQKLYHRWSLPEIRGNENREEFLATTAEVLRHDLREEIAKQQGPRSVYDDSTAGATTALSCGPSASTIGVGVEGTEKLEDDTDGGVSLL
ncbi:hypothetical protein BDV27DRAFT_168838 [Aspergillus caelatus]|uniref:OTT1508-like deaminase n=1 Tax=Aspergillus caelatus TaxID=61420 RepID=A0A5N6ZQ27_9EURO|nr:uncharacterized protein BDV27DRAFT_168838 [Aspergillus caelatus]KAE8359066.1 hypothetical protein BDV27DRAFT_168838 [Aspergillus caelatus]